MRLLGANNLLLVKDAKLDDVRDDDELDKLILSGAFNEIAVPTLARTSIYALSELTLATATTNPIVVAAASVSLDEVWVLAPCRIYTDS